MQYEIKDAKPLHEAIELVKLNIELQLMGDKIDVAYPFLVGPPGGGKTAMVNNLTKDYAEQAKKCKVISTHFATKPIEELGGIPQFDNIEFNGETVLATVWSLADILKVLYQHSQENDIIIWLLDDMHLARPEHMELMYELLTERKMRDYKLPKNVAIVLAGNHSSKAGSRTMFSAIVNRIFYMPVYTDLQYWVNNFALNYPVHPAVISFLKNDTYSKFFHEEEQVESPWCSPRAWTRFSTMLSYLEYKKISNLDSFVLYAAKGHLSAEAATQFFAYYKIFSKINIERIIENYKRFKIPENAVQKYITAYTTILHYANQDNKKRKQITEPVCFIICKFIDEAPELGLMMFKEAINLQKVTKKKIFDSIHSTMLQNPEYKQKLDGIIDTIRTIM